MSSLRAGNNAARAVAKRGYATASNSGASSSTSEAAAQLNWPQYLSLRKQRRFAGTIASVPTTIGGLAAGLAYFGNTEVDPTQLIMGIEPIWIYGLAAMSCTGLGWLAGPSVGNFFWKLVHRRAAAAMELRDKEFYEHVKRMRVDPSRQSVNNPTPDYYCEKVGSLHQYRQWLRDQAVFRRKAQFGGSGKLED